MPTADGLDPPVSSSLSSVCVFCGSSPGADPAFSGAAAALGQAVAERDMRLVYGGSHIGLMGVLADAALAAGGEVHGVITADLVDREIAHTGLTSLAIVDTMPERKAGMAGQADAFIMLPGGFGTLDEFFEMVTWAHLGIHAKPNGVLNVGGYFDPLLALVDRATHQGFVPETSRRALVVESEITVLLDRLAAS
jgi:uncharacterized protein (TIGR00730 family)